MYKNELLEKYISELIYISKYVGMRNDYVQAGGGNVSIKISADKMLIKSSGILLSDMSKTNGYSVVDYQLVKKYLLESNDLKTYIEDKIIKECIIDGKQPSIETFLHSFTKKYTIHIHPTIINMLTCQKKGKKILENLFPEAIFVEYALPGMELANRVFKEIMCKKREEIIFLKNHGIIVSGDEYKTVIEKLGEIINKVASYLKIDISKYNNVSYLYKLHIKSIKNFSNIIYLSEDSNILKAIEINNGKLWNYSMFPDSIIYCGFQGKDFTANSEGEILNAIKASPIIMLYDKNIYINAASLKKAREIESVLISTAQIYVNTSVEQLEYISDVEKNRIITSELEKFRKENI